MTLDQGLRIESCNNALESIKDLPETMVVSKDVVRQYIETVRQTVYQEIEIQRLRVEIALLQEKLQ